MSEQHQPTLRDEFRKTIEQNTLRPQFDQRQMSMLTARLAFASTAAQPRGR